MLTERSIQQAIIVKFISSSGLLMPNYTPRNWWECDLWRVTTAGYFYEYEIKLTRADWKNDGKKFRRYGDRGTFLGQGNEEYKHESIQNSENGPKHFWWVVPEGLIYPEEVQEWAGLYWAQEREHWSYPDLTEKRKAPILSQSKVNEAEQKLAMYRAYRRYIWSVRK